MSENIGRNEPYPLHPIQLVSIKTLELSIKDNPDYSGNNKEDSYPYKLGIANAPFNEKDSTITVKVRAEISSVEDRQVPYTLRAEIAGLFEVNKDVFPMDFIEDWARKNAPLILYPYLRENVYSLTTRFNNEDGAVLPLFQVPTFKFIKPEEKTP